MSNNNNSSKAIPPNSSNAPPNYQLPLQNHSQLGAGNYQNQNQNFRPPFMPNMQQPPMNPANHFSPLQNNQPHNMSPMGGVGPQNANYNNPMYPIQGQFMQNAPPITLSPLQGQMLAQSIINILQQPNMNMNIPNGGQFCAPYPMQNMNQQQLPMQNMNQQQLPMQNMNQQHLPMQNMNQQQLPMQNMNQQHLPMQNMNQQQLPMQNMNRQQLPMQVPNPSQAVPYGMHPNPHPMFGFPNQNQVPQAMLPQNPIFSSNPQFGPMPGNHVRPQIDPNEKIRVQQTGNTNASASAPFTSQQLQGNSYAPLNPNLAQPHHTNNSQPSPFMKPHSQEGPNSNVKTNFPNSNWKGSPNKDFKNKPNRGGFQGGFQKSKFPVTNNGKGRNGFRKELKGKGPHNGRRAGDFGLNSDDLLQEPKRSFSVTYSEQEIQQWREARRKNHPFNDSIQKKQSEHLKDSKVIDKEVLQRELKEVLAKQAELGVEVAEIPTYYLKNSANQDLQSEEKNTFTDKRKFRNKSNRKLDKKNRFAKKQKFAGKDFSESPSLNKRKPTLLEKLLSADIKRDKSHLFQVFRFMVVNSFFKNYPDEPLVYPSVAVKEMGSEVDAKDKHLDSGNGVLEQGNKVTVQKIVNHVSEDEEAGEILE